jgi:hypothetical protein
MEKMKPFFNFSDGKIKDTNIKLIFNSVANSTFLQKYKENNDYA